MSSEELAQLELRLTKVMAEMEARTDLSKEVGDLRADVSGLNGGLKYVNVFLDGVGLFVGGAVIKYLAT